VPGLSPLPKPQAWAATSSCQAGGRRP
jgi:hypothetical protein